MVEAEFDGCAGRSFHHEVTKATKMEFDELSKAVVGYALEVHRNAGPGLLESAYEECLAHELSCANLPCRRQVEVPVSIQTALIERRYSRFVNDPG